MASHQLLTLDRVSMGMDGVEENISNILFNYL